MRISTHSLRAIFTTVVFALAPVSAADATITLTIEEFTTTRFTVSVSGTLDIDAATPVSGGFPYKSPSQFVIVLDRFASSPFYTGTPVEQSNTLSTLVPMPTNAGMFDSSSNRYGLFFSYDQTFPQYAGSRFGGTATFTGNFNPSAARPADFQLWSGYDWFNPDAGFSVFHVTAIPECSTSGLLGFCGLGYLLRRRRGI